MRTNEYSHSVHIHLVFSPRWSVVLAERLKVCSVSHLGQWCSRSRLIIRPSVGSLLNVVDHRIVDHSITPMESRGKLKWYSVRPSRNEDHRWNDGEFEREAGSLGLRRQRLSRSSTSPRGNPRRFGFGRHPDRIRPFGGDLVRCSEPLLFIYFISNKPYVTILNTPILLDKTLT